MSIRKTVDDHGFRSFVATWRGQVLDRRAFLKSIGMLPLVAYAQSSSPARGATKVLDAPQLWRLIDAVQQHLFPSEAQAPGSTEIKALHYLQWVVDDRALDTEERGFILQGAQWLEDLSVEQGGASFLELDIAQREFMLQQVAASKAGENWLSTLLLYIFEALLVDPVYGANPDGVGWRWLGHTPGLPRPVAGKRYAELGYTYRGKVGG